MPVFNPASGTTGSVVITIGATNYTMCLDYWDYDGKIKIIDCPSFCGGDYMEYATGKKRATWSFGGTWDLNFNPFTAGAKLGVSVGLRFYINNTIQVYSPYTYISETNIRDDADEVARLNYIAIPRTNWTDFSGGVA